MLHRSPELTVFNLVWGPRMCQLPHNHGMWAVIGIYTGREDNIFWRRADDVRGPRIETAGAKALSEREAVPLGRDVIHSVVNPIKRLTGAIHVYGGDFYAVPHSQWDPEHLVEEPYDFQKLLAPRATSHGPREDFSLSAFLLGFVVLELIMGAPYGASVAGLGEGALEAVLTHMAPLSLPAWRWPDEPGRFFVRGQAFAFCAPDSPDTVSLWVGGRAPGDVAFLAPFVGPDWNRAAL